MMRQMLRTQRPCCSPQSKQQSHFTHPFGDVQEQLVDREAACRPGGSRHPMCWFEECIDLEAPSDVQEQQEKDEANAADPEALLRKREREAEEWRVSQLRAGVSAEDNANLQVSTAQQPCLSENNVAGPHLDIGISLGRWGQDSGVPRAAATSAGQDVIIVKLQAEALSSCEQHCWALCSC